MGRRVASRPFVVAEAANRSFAQALEKGDILLFYPRPRGFRPASSPTRSTMRRCHLAVPNATRFATSTHVSAYVGLVPRVYQSGETNFHGRISKEGDMLLRWLLVEAAHVP